MPKSKREKNLKRVRTGKLRIADHWNAISIIAKSQSNPLKAVAEFVENSIDAGARQIVIVRGKKKGDFYLKVSDDGDGIPRNSDGLPDFRRVIVETFPESIQSFGPGFFIDRCLNHNTDQHAHGIVYSGSQGTGRRIDMLQSRPQFFHKFDGPFSAQ